jgi:hypothetical protein
MAMNEKFNAGRISPFLSRDSVLPCLHSVDKISPCIIVDQKFVFKSLAHQLVD